MTHFHCLLKVVSPITGKEIGMREVRVVKNRETIRGMNVRILSGLQLNVQADFQVEGRYSVQTSYSQILTSKYQVTTIHCSIYHIHDTIEILPKYGPILPISPSFYVGVWKFSEILLNF